MKRPLKTLLGRGLVSTGLHKAWLADHGVVVAFHRVNNDIPEDGLTVSSKKFERFCRFFRANFDVISLGEFVGRLERGTSVAGTLAITFDDGYRDNFEVAAPILRATGLPATFFLATRYIESNVVPWWDEALPKKLSWMTWDQVRTLAQQGFDLGAHTQHHVDLGKVSVDEAGREIRGSRQDLIDKLGRAPDHFAYPYGGRANMVEPNRALVQAAGFRCCVSSYGGLATTGTDPFRLERVAISPWFQTPEQFVFELNTFKSR